MTKKFIGVGPTHIGRAQQVMRLQKSTRSAARDLGHGTSAVGSMVTLVL